jgi:hypothetical protein
VTLPLAPFFDGIWLPGGGGFRLCIISLANWIKQLLPLDVLPTIH